MVNKEKIQRQLISKKQAAKAGLIDIVYYTDPLCCWSWAMEPQWRRFQYELRNVAAVRYCMGGLISDWNNFHDSINSVSRPSQMGPLWCHAGHISGMPVYDRIWLQDPPATSYTCCVAVKCAGLQSREAEERFLRDSREAIMLDGINISKQESLFRIAHRLAGELNNFDVDQFKDDFLSGEGTAAFKEDLKEVKYKNINRFPAIIIRGAIGSVMLSGYNSSDTLFTSLQKAADVTKAKNTIDEQEYKSYFKSITNREIEEALRVVV